MILNNAASGFTAAIHDRMPVIVERENWAAWLGKVEADSAQLAHSWTRTFWKWSISFKVNRSKNNGPRILKPVDRWNHKQPRSNLAKREN